MSKTPENSGRKATRQQKRAAKDQDHKIVQEAVDNLIEKSKKHSGLTLGHLWHIFFHRNPAHTSGKILATVLVAISTIAGAGWTGHIWYQKLFPEDATIPTVTRAEMPNVLDAKTEYVSDNAPDWLYPLVTQLEATNRTALQVSCEFDEQTQGDRVELIKSGEQPEGFAFLVRRGGDHDYYARLSRAPGSQSRFIVEVPPPDTGDRLLFLTSVSGSVERSELTGLFSVRRVQ